METGWLNRAPVKSQETAWQVIDGEAVILQIPDRLLRGLNPVASRVWELVDGKRTLREIANAISGEFAHPEEQVLTDIKNFLSELVEKKLIIVPDRSS